VFKSPLVFPLNNIKLTIKNLAILAQNFGLGWGVQKIIGDL